MKSRWLCRSCHMKKDYGNGFRKKRSNVDLNLKECPICKAVGRWNVDEENSNIIVCECGEEQILNEEVEMRANTK